MTDLFKVEQLAVGGFDHNFSYLIAGPGGEAALVDPTGDAAVIRRAVSAHAGLKPQYILLTHAHRDHTEAVAACRSFFAAPVLAHPASRYPGAFPLIDGQMLPLGSGGGIEVLFTPGHTPDSACYRLSDDRGLFTGDTLFVGCCGYCEPAPMFESLKRLLQLADGNIIYSGHDYGATPTATLGEERRRNPYLNCRDLETFKEELKKL